MNFSRRMFHCSIVVAIGVVAGAVPVFDIVDDVLVGNQPVTTIVENAPLLTLSVGIVAVGGWLFRSDWTGRYTGTVARLGVANLVGAAVLMALVVLIQSELQNNLKPLIIAADAVVLGALAGIALGIRTAQQEQATDDAITQRDRFRALFENVPNPVVGVEVVGDDPIVRAVNPTFTEVFGVSRRTIIGENLESYIVPSNETADPIDGSTVAEPESTGEWNKEAIALETADGRRQFIRVTAPVEESTIPDGYAMYIDVTDQRQRRERLRVLSRTLRHDIRNQLNLIQPIATEFTDELDGAHAQQAALVESAAADILEVSDRTRTVEQRIADGGEPQPQNISRLVADIVADLRSRYDCRLVVDIDLDGPMGPVYGTVTDGFSLAVEEIVRNGIEHTDRPTPTVEVSVHPSPDSEYCEVCVADDGPGIPDTQVEVVTRQIEQTQTEHAQGLGLWTARWVLQNCGGELTFASNSPRGAVVTLRVPYADAESVDEPVA